MRILSSVSGRIYAGFTAVTSMILLVGGAATLMATSAESLFGEYRAQSRESLEIHDYLIDVQKLQLVYAEYARMPSAEGQRAVEEMVLDVATTDADGLAKFDGNQEALDAIRQATELAEQYGESFRVVVSGLSQGRAIDSLPENEFLVEMGRTIETMYADMADKVQAQQDILGPRIADNQRLQVYLILGIGVIGLLIGGIVAFVTARWISRSIGRMTATMADLAGGRHETRIVGTDVQNELGEMARALETFRANGQLVATQAVEKAALDAQSSARAARMTAFQSAFDTLMARAIDGDFSGRIGQRFEDSDIDRICDNIDGMMSSIEEGLGEADRVLGALAVADLRDRMTGDYRGAFLRLKNSTNNVASKLQEMVTELKDTSRALKLATSEILSGANDLSERTTRQAATIEETSATMESMASTVMLNAERAKEASSSAGKVSVVVEASSAVMAQTTEAMSRISDSSMKISNIIGLIDDIAFQTNLLALNASVEAARAGEAGKGFAVVAVEVRRLAQSAAEASAEIKTLIEQSASEVRAGTGLVANVADRLAQIIAGVKSTADLMESIANDSHAQATGISEVSVAVRQMDEMTQHNAALVEEMNASIEQTEGQANSLDRIVATFKVGSESDGRDRTPVLLTKRPAEAHDARHLMARVGQAAKTYFGGAAAEDWSEF